MTDIVNITPREQALERENARLLDTVRFQSEAVALMTEMKDAPYFDHYQDTLGKLAVANARVKRQAEMIEGHVEDAAEIERLKEQIAGLKADALRYAWLRTCNNDSYVLYGDTSNCELMMEEVLDAAIDAAMKESK